MTQQRRALVVRGGWDGHAPEEAAELFVPFLRESGFDVVVEGSLEVYADPALMAATDLVVQCWTMGEILADELHGLRDAVAAGTGFAGWHGGIVDSFRMATDYLQLVGAQFAAHPGGIVDHAISVVPSRSEHPVVDGIVDFSLRSEQYWLLADDLNDVLATTTIVPGPGDPWHSPVTSPAVWTRQWGEGRVFVCAPGHQLADLELPPVRTMIERGLLWAARPAT
ncbi:ThuA domain-containing protein [Cellulomonas sp. URHE0023]|uniref:ThuA domain-containing protein n=1 Tax=Cellulomonas sp. URHE0023 TaxID=1380354 RepID=UPI0004823022|nr:ThuA domain-containing protein [Cellulomonas sp. URHE0023]